MARVMVQDATTAGRPRDARIDHAVIAATRELLERDGYGRVTIGAIAERAGTTKTAIYRRWPSKAHLVHEAAFPDRLPAPAVCGDDLAGLIRSMLTAGVEVLSRPATRAAIPGLLVEFGSDASLQGELRKRFVGGTFQQLAERVDAAIACGEVRAGTSASMLLDIISGAAFLATATHRPDEIGPDWVDGIVGLIMRGIAE